jgi:peptidyl-prolyl cis-trans isomerase C
MNRNFIRWTFASLAIVAMLGAGYYNFVGRAEAEEAKPAAAPTGASLKSMVKADTVYATFDDQKVTGKDVLKVVDQLPPQLQAAPADKLLELVVNQLVNDRLVDKIAADQKLGEDPVVKERIADATKQIVRERYVEKQISGKTTDAAVKAKYEELVKSMPQQDEVRASHILVADEKTANEVLEKLKKGEDFAALAKQYSIDPTKANGGDLGYFVKTAMVKEFGDAAFAMKKGDVSKTPVKTQFGYHIIKVADMRKQQPPAFDAVKDRVKGQVTEEAIRKLVEDMRAKTPVKLNLPTTTVAK